MTETGSDACSIWHSRDGVRAAEMYSGRGNGFRGLLQSFLIIHRDLFGFVILQKRVVQSALRRANFFVKYPALVRA